ncbi:RNA splicing factor PRP9 [Mycena kentingensis (nom. inval.)]|nr:RNA splicing factor PRP9 [Mycena kentingensis (nom. inval.)]
MDSVFEVQRQTHEEIEAFERALYTLLSRNTPTHELRIQTEHRAAQVLDRIQSRVVTLSSIYDDEDRRRAELDAISGSAQQQNDLSDFYARLVKVQEHHAKYPDSVPGGFDLELSSLLEEYEQDGDDEYDEEDPISLLFSGEEAYGKYVDLYTNHVAFTNLKNIGKRPGYLQYLDVLLEAENNLVHHQLSKEIRFSKDFESYLKNLHTYLLSFAKRTMPLSDLDTEQQASTEEFDRKWAAGEISGWEENAPKTNGETGIWCAACQKNYSKQTVYDAHLTSKKHVKAQAKLEESGAPTANPNGTGAAPAKSAQSTSSNVTRIHNVALLVHLTTALLVLLLPTISETKSNVERRFSLTAKEREQELIDQAKKKAAPPPAAKEGAAEGEEEEEERIYNPLKLPLGWDGKPIPYWLYKLHGLGVEYRCEICSDQVYMGRKNFERHFQESRHAFGMRALGLPNTKHFHEITRIEDALSLAEKLKHEGRLEINEQETMEELEDDEGNVYNRKTYEDLKKQGII